MKKILLLPLLLCLCGCNATDVEDSYLATMLCIDMIEDNYYLNCEIIDLSLGENTARIVTSLSPSFQTALDLLSAKAGRSIDFSHNNIINIGQTVYENDFSDILAILTAHDEIRLNSYILFATNENAYNILDFKSNIVQGNNIYDMLKQSINYSKTVDTRLYEITSAMAEDGNILVSAINDDLSFSSAVISQYKAVDFFEDYETYIYMLLKGELKNTNISFNNFSGTIKSSSSKIYNEDTGEIVISITENIETIISDNELTIEKLENNIKNQQESFLTANMSKIISYNLLNIADTSTIYKINIEPKISTNVVLALSVGDD